MKILMICNYAGGDVPYTIFAHKQAVALAKRGHDVHVIVRVTRFKKVNQYARGSDTIQVDGVTVHYARQWSLSKWGRYGFNDRQGLRASRKVLNRLMQAGWKPDIIHAHYLVGNGWIGVKLSEQIHAPLVTVSHGYDVVMPLREKKEDYLRNILMRTCWITAVSAKLANMIQQKILLEKKDISVICNGYDAVFLPLQKSKKVEQSLIFVGALIHQKGAHVFIKAFNTIAEEFPYATLTIVGEGSEKTLLQSLARRNEKRIVFTGHISNREVMQKMAESEIFCMPSVNEGFGIVYLEAMANGCLTIGTRGEGIDGTIINGENGFLLSPFTEEEEKTVSQLANILRMAFHNKEMMQRLAEKGRQDAKEYTWERNVEKYEKGYKQCLLKFIN